MSVVAIPFDEYTLLKIVGMLDGQNQTSEDLLGWLRLREDQVQSNYVLDLSAIEGIRSIMLGELVRFLGTVQKVGFTVLLLQPPKRVYTILELTGLTEVFTVVASELEIHEALGISAEPTFEPTILDYDALSQEIEDIITGESTSSHPQLDSLRPE